MPDPQVLTDDQKWRGRIAMAKRYQEKFGNTDDRWDRFVRGLAGDFNSRMELGDEAIDVNITRSDVKTRLAPLWLQEPHVTFTPTTERVQIGENDVDNIRRAEFSEAEINYWFRELEIRTKVCRPCVLDSETTNHGYAYVGYTSKKVEVEQDGEKTEANPLVRFKQPFVIRKSPREVLLQPGFEDIESCEWIVLLFDRRLEDARDRYKKPDLKESRTVDEKISSGATGAMREYLDSEDAKLVEIQVVWDKRSKTIKTFADGHEDMLEEESWDLELEGFPLVDLRFEDIPDEYYGTPSQQYAYPQQKELNAYATKLRKRFNRSKRIIMTSGDVSPDVADAYKKADDNEIIRTGLTGDEDIRRHFIQEEILPQDQSTLMYGAVIQDNYRQIQGTSAEQRGSGDPNVKSATSSANIEKNSQIRSTDRGDRVKEFYEKIARKLWMILQQQPNVERDRRIAGPLANQFKRLKYTLEELRGEFAVEVNIATVLPEDPASRQTLALLNYKMLRVDPLINGEKLILDLLKSQNKTDLQSYLLTLRDPEEEFEMMLMEGLPVEPHQQDDHERHLEQHELQMAQLEQALDRAPPEARRKVQLAGALMMAHMNSHEKILAQIVGAQGRQPGNPADDNVSRNLMSSAAGSETDAELGGQALTGPTGSLI